MAVKESDESLTFSKFNLQSFKQQNREIYAMALIIISSIYIVTVFLTVITKYSKLLISPNSIKQEV